MTADKGMGLLCGPTLSRLTNILQKSETPLARKRQPLNFLSNKLLLIFSSLVRIPHETAMRAYGSQQSLRCADYRVGWVCALALELTAAKAMLDTGHGRPSDLEILSGFDDNQYEFGQIGGHNVVLAVLPSGGYGVAQAALAANMMKRAFPAIQFALLVGIGGGVPSRTNDIRLGDVVVSTPVAGYPGVLQYDLGKRGLDEDITTTGVLRKPARKALAATNVMRARYMMIDNDLSGAINEALEKYPRMCDDFSHPGMVNDVLYRADYDHVSGDDCSKCSNSMMMGRRARKTNEPRIHYGLIGSGNQVIKNGKFRERLKEKHNILCFEMEAAGALVSGGGTTISVMKFVSDFESSGSI